MDNDTFILLNSSKHLPSLHFVLSIISLITSFLNSSFILSSSTGRNGTIEG